MTLVLSELTANCKTICAEKYPQPGDKGEEVRPGMWVAQTTNGSKRYSYECAVCKEPDPMIFMVNDELWERTQLKGMICAECFEGVIGRPLTFDDLRPCYATLDAIRHYEWIKKISRRFPVPDKAE